MGQITGGLVASSASTPGIDLIDTAKSGFGTHTSMVPEWLQIRGRLGWLESRQTVDAAGRFQL